MPLWELSDAAIGFGTYQLQTMKITQTSQYFAINAIPSLRQRQSCLLCERYLHRLDIDCSRLTHDHSLNPKYFRRLNGRHCVIPRFARVRAFQRTPDGWYHPTHVSDAHIYFSTLLILSCLRHSSSTCMTCRDVGEMRSTRLHGQSDETNLVACGLNSCFGQHVTILCTQILITIFCRSRTAIMSFCAYWSDDVLPSRMHLWMADASN